MDHSQADFSADFGLPLPRIVARVQNLTREEVINGRRHADAVVRSADFLVDIHNPAGPGQAEGFTAKANPYAIPYGCLSRCEQ